MTNRVHTSLDWQAIVMGLSGSRFEPYGGANVWKSDGRMHMFDTRLPDKNGLVKAPDARPWEKEIDKLVYQLYKLEPEEIEIIESVSDVNI